MEKTLSEQFSKIKGISRTAEPSNGINDISRISEPTFLKGEINSSNDIRIDGKVEGKIFSRSRVVIGEKAVINGTIVCNVLDLWGTVEGEIFVKDVLSLKGSAVVTGNIHVRKFQVELGAQVNGTFKMISDAELEDASGKEPEVPGDAPAEIF